MDYQEQARPLNVHVSGRRILAVFVDYLILAFILGLLFSLIDGFPFGLVSGLWWALLLRPLYHIGLEGYWGQTLGKRLFSIKVVSERTGEIVGFGPATARNLPRLAVPGFVILLMVVLGNAEAAGRSSGPVIFGAPLVGLLVMAISKKRQRIGDKVAHTLVVSTT